MPAPTISDLIFSEQANHNFSKTLGAIKRSTLSIHNRLHSIEEDAKFAERVAGEYNNRPLIANERCGSWYIDPFNKAGSAYFKSTDGHTGVWKFSSRRLNLHLLELIGKHDGCIIVDSTRRGKRMPDALSKTVPIWCSVLNRLLFPDDIQSHKLHIPRQVVSESEHAQISNLLPSYLKSFQDLQIPLARYKGHVSKPLRPVWVTPHSYITSTTEVYRDAHPVICCTVSRVVPGGEASEGGYIQGAGDDTENWAHDLSPAVFWANRHLLFSTPESDLPDLIKSLVSEPVSITAGRINRCIRPTTCLFVTTLSEIPLDTPGVNTCIIALKPKVANGPTESSSPFRLEVEVGPHKMGSRDLRVALPAIIDFIESFLRRVADAEVPTPFHKRIILACENGKDISVGVALAVLCLFFDEDGELLKTQGTREKINKPFIRRRLGWISTSMPDANPNRATLQSINSFLMVRR